jgi:RNA polymerase sigma-70 factor (ECF subfamily)
MSIFPSKNLKPKQMQEFVGLLTEHQDIIRLYIRSIISAHDDTRDLLQEVNIKLWQNMGSFKLGTNFGAWSCTIAYYEVLTYRRKLKRDGFMVLNDELYDTLSKQVAEKKPDFVDHKRWALSKCLGKVSEKNLKLLEARYSGQVTGLEEEAAASGKSLGTVYVTLSRVRTSLKKCIEQRLTELGGLA